MTFKIINQETGKELALGENGLIIVREPNVMKGYLDDAERTATCGFRRLIAFIKRKNFLFLKQGNWI